MSVSPSALLERLAQIYAGYDRGAAPSKLHLLRRLEQTVLPRPTQVQALHELLCFLRAYPDDREVLDQVEKMLVSFRERRDLRRHRRDLTNSGIAGTDIDYRFFWFMARWLARRWPDRLSIDWSTFERKELLDRWLTMLMPPSETLGLEEEALSTREWVRRLKGPEESDAVFIIRRFESLNSGPFREKLYEELDLPCRLAAGPATPNRTTAWYDGAPMVFQSGPLIHSRDAFLPALKKPPLRERKLAPGQARELIDLAREAMVTRERDLDVFIDGNEDDVRLLDAGNGLQFVCIGAVPERRQLLDSVYGFLLLKNGIPIGYFLTSSLFNSSEVAYNIFEAYRGAEAALVYGRSLAMTRHLFASDTFVVDPYQLGHGNREGLESGAWWFYYKLGFRPHDPETLDLVARELKKIAKNPRHRSSLTTLERLSAVEMYFHLKKKRSDVLGLLSRGALGLSVIRYMSERFGARREAGIRTCSKEVALMLGLRSLRGFTRGEREAWDRWCPLICILPGVRDWSAADRKALVRVVRAKGGRRESDFVRLFDTHRPLRSAIRKLAVDPD